MPKKSRGQLLIERIEAAEKAKDSLLAYARFVMPDAKHPDDPDLSQYFVARHHEVIARALERLEAGSIKRLIITVPPRHGKTQLASKLFPAWYSGRHPEHHFIFGTYNEIYAKDVGRGVRDFIQHPAHKQVFSKHVLKEGSAASDRLETKEGAILAFVGRGGTTTGRGGHILIIDDPIKNQAEAKSPTIRNELWDWYTKVVTTRMMDKNARILIIMTRWHEDDLIGRITDPTNEYYDPDEAALWHIIDLPALAMENDPLGRKPGEALWPERFDAEFMEDRRRQDPRGFAALYQGRPTPQGGAFFQESWLKTYKIRDLPNNLRYYAASDHAVSTLQNRDKTCLIPVGLDEQDNIYVLPDVWWRQAQTDLAVDAMIDIMKRRKPLYWWGERGQISKAIGPFLRKRMAEDSVSCTLIEMVPTADKQTRASSIHGRIAMGKVFFPEDAPWWSQAKAEILKFPSAAHDDFVDALAYIGLGLAMQVPAQGQKKSQAVKERTFAQLLEESNARRRMQSMARATGGW